MSLKCKYPPCIHQNPVILPAESYGNMNCLKNNQERPWAISIHCFPTKRKSFQNLNDDVMLALLILYEHFERHEYVMLLVRCEYRPSDW